MNRQRRRGLAAVTIVSALAALLSPLVVASSAQAADVSGQTLGVNAGSWLDTTLESEMIRGVNYSSTLRAPSGLGLYYGLTTTGLPAGLSAGLDITTGYIFVGGTPTTAASGINFSMEFNTTAGGGPYYIAFTGFTVAASATTATTVTSATFAASDDVSLSAQVTGSNPTGTVTFSLGSTVVGTGAVNGSGTATYDGAVPVALVGTSSTLTASYGGDSVNAPSVSTSTATVYVYASSTVTGTVTSNGVPVAGDVELLSGTTVIDTDTAASDGVYSLTAPDPTTLVEAQAEYVIRSVETGTYYSTSAGPGQPNVTTASAASPTGRASWGTPKNIYLNVAPTWTDQTIASPRLGSAYSDGVSATGTSPIVYSVTSGSLPSWLRLDAATGALTGTAPADQASYTFVLSATGPFASVSKSFTLAAVPGGAVPAGLAATGADPLGMALAALAMLTLGLGLVLRRRTAGVR